MDFAGVVTSVLAISGRMLSSVRRETPRGNRVNAYIDTVHGLPPQPLLLFS